MTAPVRLFVSSPSDVAAERMAVERVARRLEGLFDNVAIEVYRWEKDRYYSAHTGFQEQIAEIGGFDLVVGVLWSRLGSPLPPGFSARMPPPRVGEGYPSGTAFELLEAIRLRRARDSAPPDVLIYRKITPANTAAADDEAAHLRQLAELQAVNRFVADYLVNQQDGYKGAFKTVLTLDDFEATLQADLTAWLKANRRIGTALQWRIEDRGAPYVGLDAFGADHREVFFGRREEVERARERLEAGQGFLLIDGASGTGKSSLVRAGLLPRLSDLDPHLRIAITVPETDAPLMSLVQAVFAPGALPDLGEGDYPTAGALTGHLLAGGDVAPILRALDRAALRRKAEERLDEPPQVKLLLLVDQLEALFAKRVSDQERTAYARLIEQLVVSDRAMIIATLRANAREEALALPSLGRLINRRQGLGLEPPGADALGAIVRDPAEAAAIVFERDADGIGLDRILIREIVQDPAALPLLQFVLERLYQSAANRVRSNGRRLGDAPPGEPVLTLTHADYRATGGLWGAIGQQAEAALSKLPETARDRLPALVRALTEDSGGTLVLGRATVARAAPDVATKALVAALVDARILVQGMSAEGDGATEPVLRFTHERVLTAWDRARVAAEAAATYIRVRADLVQAEARWREAGRKRDELLTSKARLGEAEDAVRDYGEELDRLDHGIRAYVKASSRSARLRLQFATAASVVFLLVAVAAGWFGFVAREQSAEAAAQTRTALQNQRNAMVALALSRIETDPVEALKLVLAAWPTNFDDPFPDLQMVRTALRGILASQRPHVLIEAHEPYWPYGAVFDLEFSPDSEYLISVGPDSVVRKWEVESGQLVREFDAQSPSAVAFIDAASDLTVAVTRGDSIEIRDNEKINVLGSITLTPQISLMSIVPVPGERSRLLSHSNDGTIRLWDLDSGAQIGETISGYANLDFNQEGTLASSTTGEFFAYVDSSRNIVLRNAGDPSLPPFMSIPAPEANGTLALSADGALIAASNETGGFHVWQIASGAVVSSSQGRHGGAVGSLLFSPDGSYILSGGLDGLLKIWDVRVQTH